MQLDLFNDLCEINHKVKDYKDSADKVRRGVFARLDNVKKEVDEKLQAQNNKIDEIHYLLNEMQKMYSIFNLEKAC